MTDAVLRIDADTEAVSVKLRKVGEQFKKIGTDGIKDFDARLGRSTKGLDVLPGKFLSIAAAIGAVSTALHIADRVNEKLSDRAKAANAQALSEGAAVMRAGGSSAENRHFINMPFAPLTTLAGRTKFLAGIGQIQEERRAQGLPQITERQLSQLRFQYLEGGDLVHGEGGSELLGDVRAFPFAPNVGTGRRLAGRLGKRYAGHDIFDLIKQNLSGVSADTQTALAAQRNAEFTTLSSLGAGMTTAAQNALARKEGYARLDAAAPGFVSTYEATAGHVAGSGDKFFGGEAVDVLKGIREDLNRNLGGPTLPNQGARNVDGVTP